MCSAQVGVNRHYHSLSEYITTRGMGYRSWIFCSKPFAENKGIYLLPWWQNLASSLTQWYWPLFTTIWKQYRYGNISFAHDHSMNVALFWQGNFLFTFMQSCSSIWLLMGVLQLVSGTEVLSEYTVTVHTPVNELPQLLPRDYTKDSRTSTHAGRVTLCPCLSLVALVMWRVSSLT